MDDAEAKRRQEEMEKREEARLARSLGKPRAVVAKPHKPSATTGATQTLTKPAATPKPAAVPCAAANPVRGGSSQPTLSPEAESAQAKREEERMNKMLQKMGGNPVQLTDSEPKISSTASKLEESRKLRTDGSRPALSKEAEDSQAKREAERFQLMGVTVTDSEPKVGRTTAPAEEKKQVRVDGSRPAVSAEEEDAQAKREEERLNKMLTKMGNKPIHLSESDSSPSKTTSAPATERKLRTDGSRPAVTQDKEEEMARKEEERLMKSFQKHQGGPPPSVLSPNAGQASTGLLSRDLQSMKETIEAEERLTEEQLKKAQEREKKLDEQRKRLESEYQNRKEQAQKNDEDSKSTQSAADKEKLKALEAELARLEEQQAMLETMTDSMKEDTATSMQRSSGSTSVDTSKIPASFTPGVEDPSARPIPPTYEADMVAEINKIRQDPKNYVAVLQERAKCYHGLNFNIPNSDAAIETREGVDAVKDAIATLRKLSAAPPLELVPGLCKSCGDLVNDNGPRGLMGAAMSDGTDSSVRLLKYGRWQGKVSELMSYGPRTDVPQNVVLQWLIDDGNPQRQQREAMLDPMAKVFGCSIGHHSKFEWMAVAVLSRGYASGGGVNYSNTTETSVKEKVSLEESADGKAFVVTTEPLEVPKEQIKLTKSGLSLLLAWHGKEGNKTFTHQWKLPFDIPANNIDAVYDPATTSVGLTLHKSSEGDGNNFLLREYSLEAEEAAPSNRLKTGINQAKGYFTFVLNPCQSEVDIAVKVQDGSTLCFESVYTDVTKDPNGTTTTKTITRNETLKIPFNMSREMFEFEPTDEKGVKVTLYKPGARKETGDDKEAVIPIR